MKISQGLWAVIAVVVAAGLGAYIWITGQGTAPQVDAGVEQTVSATPQAETAPVLATEEPAPVTPVEEAPAVPEAEEVQEAEADLEPTPEGVTEPVIRRPVIEVARVDPSGEVLLAGQGSAKATIEALVDDAVAVSGEIGADENFVLFFDIEPSDQPRIISLRRVDGDEFVYSEQEVIVAPGQIKAPIAVAVADEALAPEPEVEVVETTQVDVPAEVIKAPETTEETATATLPDETVPSVTTEMADQVKEVQDALDNAAEQVATAVETTAEAASETAVEETIEIAKTVVEGTKPAVAAVADLAEVGDTAEKITDPDPAEEGSETSESNIAAAPEQPVQVDVVQQEDTPTVMIADVSGVKIVSKAPTSAENPEIFLDTISYDDEGALTLAGRGVSSGIVRLYLNNAVFGETLTDALGAWSYDASAIEPGVYTLRIDQLNADASKVLARMETPFKREARSKLQEQLSAAESPARINVVTVQPGNTLWGISRERYGQGILYVQVFEANRDKIRDPDLIYPGQIFNLPDDTAKE